MSFNQQLLLFFAAVAITSSIHFLNAQYLKSAGIPMREGVSVITSDDASYLAPAENLLSKNEWKSNAAGDAAYATRSPGYGMIYLAFRGILPPKGALIALVTFQILLYAFALTRIPHLAGHLGLNKRWGMALAWTFALLPGFWGFLGYTLTEGVVPALVVLFLHHLFKSTHTGMRDFTIASVVLGICILIRPPMLVWIFTPLVLLWFNRKSRGVRNGFAALILTVIPLFGWLMWTVAKTGAWQGLHPIYHSDANDLYRPLHGDIWNFHKAWGQTGEDFHRGIGALWDDALNDRNPEETVNRIIGSTDRRARDLLGDSTLRVAYFDYHEILRAQAPFFRSGQAMSGISTEEERLSARFQAFAKSYIRHHPFHAFAVVPAQVFWRLTAHSNLSMYMFQKPLRGKTWVEALRLLSFGLHFGAFICVFVGLGFFQKNRKALATAASIAIYLVYLCGVQRGVEERYTAPMFIPAVLLMSVIAAGILAAARRRIA